MANFFKKTDIIFVAFAAIFIVAGLHHAYEYFDPSLRPDYPPLRHLVFTVINFAIAFFMIKRTKFMVPVLVVISIQQIYGHGGNLITNFETGSPPLYTDLAVVVFIPLMLVMYVYDIWWGNDGRLNFVLHQKI